MTPPLPRAPAQFAVYEPARAAAAAALRAVGGAGAAPAAADDARAQLAHVAGGAAAGTLGKLVVYPLDTVKKRAQAARMVRTGAYGQPHAAYAGALHTLRALAAEDDDAPRRRLLPRAWFKGLAPSLLKAALGTAATFWAYEFAAAALRKQPWACRDPPA